MRKISKTKKIVAVAAIAAAVVAGSGAAYAYWTTTGTGTGTVTAAAAASPVTAVQTTAISNLAPGVAAQVLAGNFTNPNPGPVYITTVVASISSVVKAGGAPAGTCDATDFTLASPSMGVGAEVVAGSAKGAWSGATISFNNKPSTNQDACKGATVNLAYAVS